MPTRSERVAGGLVGLLVGDALGVPYEFHPASAIPAAEWIEMEPPAGFRRAHSGVPPGTWSDDGAEALCLLGSLLDCGRLDLDDLGRRLLAWLDEGLMAVDGWVFDVGIQTSRALSRLRSGVPAVEAGPAEERANGNGSLMRVLPLALWHRGTDQELIADAMMQSRVTHAHPRSQVCCALYCLWARRILEAESPDPWSSAVATLRKLLPAQGPERFEPETTIRPDDPASGRGSGYVVDCLHSARMVLAEHAPFEAVARAAIALGDDTDTTACVAGGLAGLRDGVESIPIRWRKALRGREVLDPLLSRLLIFA